MRPENESLKREVDFFFSKMKFKFYSPFLQMSTKGKNLTKGRRRKKVKFSLHFRLFICKTRNSLHDSFFNKKDILSFLTKKTYYHFSTQKNTFSVCCVSTYLFLSKKNLKKKTINLLFW